MRMRKNFRVLPVHQDGTAPAVKLAIKCVVTALLLWIAFRTVDIRGVSTLLSRLDLWSAVAAFLLTGLLIASDSVLLAGILRAFGRRLSAGTALLYSLVGWFFSNVAPSTVGGDVFRAVQLSRAGMTAGAAARVVISQRALSFATLVLVMLAGFPIALRLADTRQETFLLSIVVLIAVCAIAALLLLVHLPVRGSALERWALFRQFETASEEFRRLLVPTVQNGVSWFSALLQHLLRVLILACLAAGLKMDVTVAALFALTPAALLVAMAPISLGGWGVRELTFVYFLGIAGVSAESALALSIVFGLVRLVVGALGGLAWLGVNDGHFRVDASSA